MKPGLKDVHFETLEALIIYPQQGLRQVQLLSDQGTRLVDGCPCKALADPARRSFRSFWVTP